MTAPQSIRELFDQLGLQEVPSADGTLTLQMPVDERVVNTSGGLQGGLIATMADDDTTSWWLDASGHWTRHLGEVDVQDALISRKRRARDPRRS